MTGDRERLARLLGTADTVWLLQRMRTRLEQQGELSGTVAKVRATQGERTAVARLFGRTARAGQSASVSLDALDVVLRRGAWPEGLESAVVALTGPYLHPDERRGTREAWQAATDRIRELAERHPQSVDWADSVIRSGALKRAAGAPAEAQRIADQLMVLADALPSDAQVIGVLAAQLYGDAHALDARTPLGTLGAGLAAALGGVAGGVTAGSGAHARREAWASVGVVVDELSSWVLTLGLTGGTESPTARALAVLSEAGQPAVLTYRQLAADALGRVPAIVYVCENPAVVAAAADGPGTHSAPVVCLGGQPGAAAVRLLTRLSEGGAELRYHGDFDAGGMAIARTLARHVPWRPWHFSAADYVVAVTSLPDLGSFTGVVRETPWSAELASALEYHRLRVEEESVLEPLLADLRASPEAGKERVGRRYAGMREESSDEHGLRE